MGVGRAFNKHCLLTYFFPEYSGLQIMCLQLIAVRRKTRNGGREFIFFDFLFHDISCNITTQQLVKPVDQYPWELQYFWEGPIRILRTKFF